jgi:hypothetical protein
MTKYPLARLTLAEQDIDLIRKAAVISKSLVRQNPTVLRIYLSILDGLLNTAS